MSNDATSPAPPPDAQPAAEPAYRPVPEPDLRPDPERPEDDGPAPPLALTAPQLKAAADTFGLLAAPTRLHLVWLLARQEHDVGSLAQRTGATIAAVSQHLAKLRLAGLVAARRHGRHQIYAVEDPHVLTLVDQIFAHIAPDGTLAPDPPSPKHPARPEDA